MSRIASVALVLVIVATSATRGQAPPVTIPGTEVRRLHSEILDRDLELFVKLPWSYGEKPARYRVLFCVDGNRSFPLWATTSLMLETPGSETEEIVVVGIGYSVSQDRLAGLADWASWRTQDLTPVRRPDVEASWEARLSAVPGRGEVDVRTGGAAAFLAALRNEIVPFVEAEYRVSSEGRGLAGYSYGGLFTLYAMFHAPEAFDRFFAGSPSMWDELFVYEEAFASGHSDLPATLFLSAAGSESRETVRRMRRMADLLRGRGFDGLRLETHIFDGETHASGYPAAVSRALRVLYYAR